MFKFNNKDMKWTYSTPFSSVFIVDFGHVNAHKDQTKKLYILHVVVKNCVLKQGKNNIFSKIFSFNS